MRGGGGGREDAEAGSLSRLERRSFSWRSLRYSRLGAVRGPELPGGGVETAARGAGAGARTGAAARAGGGAGVGSRGGMRWREREEVRMGEFPTGAFSRERRRWRLKSGEEARTPSPESTEVREERRPFFRERRSDFWSATDSSRMRKVSRPRSH